MSIRRLKVLIVAHEFSPYSGSECAVGWNIVTRLARYHDVTVLYASGSQADRRSYVKAVKNYFSNNPEVPGLTLINIDQPGLSRLLSKLNFLFARTGPIGLPFIYYLGYNSWQKAVYRSAKNLHQHGPFDIAHQLTQISFREPGYLWKLGIPFFWGPTGGVSVMPAKYYKTLSFGAMLIEAMRSVSNMYQESFVSRIKQANKRASVIYTFSVEDEFFFKRRALGQVRQMLDVGTNAYPDGNIKEPVENNILTAVWCGQLTYRKAPALLLKALAMSKVTREGVKVKIIGTGPLEEKMHKLAESLELKNIEWIRQVQHEEIFRIMQKADFLIHTSLREATSSVIPEALSVGLPVICHDANGMRIAVDETCGLKIPFESPEKSITGFHDAVEKFIFDGQLLADLKLGARQRSIELSWDNMAYTIAVDYKNRTTFEK